MTVEKSLVTGGAGSIGSHLVDRLLDKVHDKTKVHPMKLRPRGLWNALRKSLRLENLKESDEHLANSSQQRRVVTRTWLAALVIAALPIGMAIAGCAQPDAPTQAPSPATEVSVVLGKQGIDLSSYRKIELDESRIEVSSTNQPGEGKENLITGLGVPYWHAKFPKEPSEEWVVVDLGGEARLSVLAVRPRTEHLDQIWRGDAAVLEGSNDKQEWITEVKLELNPEELDAQDWIAFVLPEEIGPYRYYRLFISDLGFLALGGLWVYGEGGIPVVKPE